ncbi:hypothetical protein POR1_47 [Pseudomonas phage POR1]|uniref:Uncharacterized protein n=1 Tax=Pseudomonas phage POR1 TaxID=1718594 RepID=A0A0N9RZ01_9CAUD|nr:hypothetical protein POR1_47 [Pseudomonas phage POR1]
MAKQIKIEIPNPDKDLPKIQMAAIGRALVQRTVTHLQTPKHDCPQCGKEQQPFRYQSAACDHCLVKNGYVPANGLSGFMGHFYPLLFWNAIAEGATWEDLKRMAEWIPDYLPQYIEGKDTSRPLRDMRNNPINERCQSCGNGVPAFTRYKNFCSHTCYVRHYRATERVAPKRVDSELIKNEREKVLTDLIYRAPAALTVKHLCDAPQVRKAFDVKAVEPTVGRVLKELVERGALYRFAKGSTTGKPEFYYTTRINEARDNCAFLMVNKKWGNKLPNGMAWT